MLIALLLTLLIECATLFLLRQRDPLLYLYWAALTLLTNVILNTYLSLVTFGNTTEYWFTVAICEILVFVSELFLCYLYTKNFKLSAKYSAICNIASFVIGGMVIAIVK